MLLWNGGIGLKPRRRDRRQMHDRIKPRGCPSTPISASIVWP